VRRLLLVDDDPALRMITRVALAHGGVFEVHDVDSGASALERLRRESFDVLVVDVMMPSMDGPTLVRRVLEELAPAPRVVFLTAKTGARERQRLLALGAAGVLSKPYDPITLVAAVVQAAGLG